MLDYLYQIEKLFNDVDVLKVTAAILGLAVAVLICIVISNSYRINALEKRLYDIERYNFNNL